MPTNPGLADRRRKRLTARPIGAGRTVDDHRAGTGSFCTTCGVRNDEAAKFFDACGQPIG
jgi:hypothetical protein